MQGRIAIFLERLWCVEFCILKIDRKLICQFIRAKILELRTINSFLDRYEVIVV